VPPEFHLGAYGQSLEYADEAGISRAAAGGGADFFTAAQTGRRPCAGSAVGCGGPPVEDAGRQAGGTTGDRSRTCGNALAGCEFGAGRDWMRLRRHGSMPSSSMRGEASGSFRGGGPGGGPGLRRCVLVLQRQTELIAARGTRGRVRGRGADSGRGFWLVLDRLRARTIEAAGDSGPLAETALPVRS